MRRETSQERAARERYFGKVAAAAPTHKAIPAQARPPHSVPPQPSMLRGTAVPSRPVTPLQSVVIEPRSNGDFGAALGDGLSASIFSIPSNNKVAGVSTGLTTDLDNLYTAVTNVAGFNVCNAAYSSGADPTGSSASDSAFNAAITSVSTAGGMIIVPPGTYKITSGVSAVLGSSAGPVVIWLQAGAFINYTGSGDCFRMYSTGSSPSGRRSGIIGEGVIDGTNAGNGAVGVHIGDLQAHQLHVTIQNFAGTGSIGVHYDNSVSWTEQCDDRVILINNTQSAVFEVTTGNTSFDYGNWDFEIGISPGQDGVIFKNGPSLWGTSLFRIRGNFGTQGTTFTNWVWKWTGESPGGSIVPNQGINFRGNVDISVETDGGLAYAHGTLSLDANSSFKGQGRMFFSPGAFTVASLTSGCIFDFYGFALGDTTIVPASLLSGVQLSTGGQTVNSQTPAPITSISSVTVNSGVTYHVDFYVEYSTTSSAGAPIFSFSTTTSFTTFIMDMQEEIIGTPTTWGNGAYITARASTLTGVTFSGTQSRRLRVKGILLPSGANTFQPEVACSVAADTWTVNLATLDVIPIT